MGVILLYNMNMVIDGSFSDYDELNSFVSFSSPATIECPREIAERLTDMRYDRITRSLFEMTAPIHEDIQIEEQTHLSDMCDTVCACFDIPEADLWLTDLSHRIRHHVTRAYMYQSSCAAVDFETPSTAYISNAATPPSDRGKGHAAKLLHALTESIILGGKTPCLWCYQELEGFYTKVGFTKKDSDIMLMIKE